MSIYASETAVPVDRSKAEIEKILARYGADQFMHGWQSGRAVIMFRAHERMVRFELQIPELAEFAVSPKGRRRPPTAIQEAWEQACRQRWRALSLVIKAKLEAVASGITVFEEEFLAHIVLPGGKTVGQTLVPQLEQVYATGKVPPMLSWDKEKSS